jgi:hypothetical protein
VLDGVWVVRTGGFKNLLEEAFGWPCASIEIVFGHHHELLVGVINFFPNAAIARPSGEVVWAAVLPLLLSFRVLSGTSGGDLGRCGPAINDG